jgi:ketosteroid isomerase-like protein
MDGGLVFARTWIAAWNSHDLDAILDLYAENVRLTSPLAARLRADVSGTLRGKESLRSYFARILRVRENLAFELIDCLTGNCATAVYYRGVACLRALEVMRRDGSGKVVNADVFYSRRI